MATGIRHSIVNEKTAVTGATGLVGSHLVAELIRCGYRHLILPVRNMSSLAKLYATLEREGLCTDGVTLEVFETSLTNPVRLKRVFEGARQVFNCAAMVAIGGMDENTLAEINTSITAHVVNAALECGAGKLIHVSSIATINSSNNENEPADESDAATTLPVTSGYAASKFMSEHEVMRGEFLGLKTVTVNPATILGIGNPKESSGAIIPLLSKGTPFYTGGITPFVDVKDVAKAMVMLAEDEMAAGQKFILAAQNVSYRQLIGMANRITGHRPPYIKLTGGILSTAAFADKAVAGLCRRRPLLTQEMAKILSSKIYYSGEKIKKTLNFDYTPLEETITRLITQHMQNTR